MRIKKKLPKLGYPKQDQENRKTLSDCILLISIKAVMKKKKDFTARPIRRGDIRIKVPV